VQAHDPDEQLLNEHVAPWAQAISHVPLEQLTVQVPPVGQDVLQCPAEQSMLHVPPPQYVRQWPLEQSSVQSPVEGQVSSQLPAEQSAVHGLLAHAAVQFPEEQLQVPPPQDVLLREAGVPGSAIAGPPLGVPVVVDELDPPQAPRAHVKRTKEAKKRCIRLLPFSNGHVWTSACWTRVARRSMQGPQAFEKMRAALREVSRTLEENSDASATSR
jgi:hypothetical protein